LRDVFFTTEFEPFQEKVVEYNYALTKGTKFANKIVYIKVLNNLSRDCDCIAAAEAPAVADIGIFASLDPVAVEKASMDAIYQAPDSQHLVTRMEAFRGPHQIRHAARLGLGRAVYELVKLD
jgi:uncharacterized Fe-S center protein